jgi:hypothetical protein
MTRRKAIKTAVTKAWGIEGDWSNFHDSAAIAYDLGRIAGLKEGANMAMADGGWTPTIRGIKRKSRALAKELKQC